MTDFSDLTLRTSIGVQLRRIRRARGKDVETVAASMGLSVSDVEAIEDGTYEDLDYESIRAYVSSCGTDCWDIVDEAKLVSQIYVLNQLMEEFLGQDLSRHDMAAAVADVVCRAVRTAYGYYGDETSAAATERDIVARVCDGVRASIDSCEYVPCAVPEARTVPIDESLEDILAEALDGYEEFDDGFGPGGADWDADDGLHICMPVDGMPSVDDDPPVIVPEEIISDQDSFDMEVGNDG